MYKIYCDETWTADHQKVKNHYWVFYGVLIKEEHENRLLEEIDCFKRERGLYINDKPIEIKWKKVDQEWKDARKTNRKSRYVEFLDIFFQALRRKELSFGAMYLKKSAYKKVEALFVEQRQETTHDFFFMLCFQFLYHCFIKNQVKENPCQIYIDNRNLGAKGNEYNPDKLRKILNRRVYRDLVPKNQLVLSAKFQIALTDSIRFIDLRDSKEEPLIQLADLCAGCFRYVLENEMPPPQIQGQLNLFEENTNNSGTEINTGKAELATTFYRKLRSIQGYEDLNLLKPSYHHRFYIFPFQFSK